VGGLVVAALLPFVFCGYRPEFLISVIIFSSSQASVWCTCGRARSHCTAILGHLAYPAETRPVHPVFHALSSGASLAANKIGIGDFYRELLHRSLTIWDDVCAAMTSAGEGDRDDAEQDGSL
jgi:hypothetical protein